MKSIDKNEAGAGFAGRTAAVAALLVIMLTGAAVGFAQAGTSTGSTATANPADSSRNVPATSAAQSPAKGTHEGIGVHGYWTIDVTNPDGTLARHVEFENGLCIGTGDQVMARLLTAGGTTGGWEVKLGNPTIPSGAATAHACSDLNFGNSLQFLLEQNNDFYSTSGTCAGVNALFPTVYCFPTLTAPTTGGSAVTLAGQFTVPAGTSSTQITAVGTAVSSCATLTGTQCVTEGTSTTDFTGAYLTGVAPMPAAITVVAGQSVSVNVQLSFH
jgi:hypothetical protein